LLDFHAVGVERVIPIAEVRNAYLEQLFNNRGRVYKPQDVVYPMKQSRTKKIKSKDQWVNTVQKRKVEMVLCYKPN
jgi:hypothetical protein